jgi:hypothetical protein
LFRIIHSFIEALNLAESTYNDAWLLFFDKITDIDKGRVFLLINHTLNKEENR